MQQIQQLLLLVGELAICIIYNVFIVVCIMVQLLFYAPGAWRHRVIINHRIDTCIHTFQFVRSASFHQCYCLHIKYGYSHIYRPHYIGLEVLF